MHGDIYGQKWQTFIEVFKDDLIAHGYDIGDYYLIQAKDLNKGNFFSYISEIKSNSDPKFRVGLAYQLSIKTDALCSTYELSVAMTEHHLAVLQEMGEKGYRNFIMVTDISESDFDGVCFDGMKNFLKVAMSRNPNLLGSITVLPRNAPQTVMNFYSSIIPKIYGVKEVNDSAKIILNLLKKV